MSKRIVALFLACLMLLSLCGIAGADDVKTVTITMRYDSTSVDNIFRMEMLKNGFRRLEAEDPSVHFEFEDMQKLELNDLVLQYNAGVVADLFIDYEDVTGKALQAGIIQDVDWFFDLENVQGAFFSGIQDLCTYDGHAYMIPVDLCANMLSANKRVLKELGWTDEDIASWPTRVMNGEWTMDDLYDTAKAAVDQGLVKYGFMLDGIDKASCYTLENAFGITSYNAETGELVFDTEEWTRFYDFWSKCAVNGVIPTTLKTFSGTYQSFLDEETLFFTDVSSYSNWLNKSGMEAKEFGDYYQEHFTQALMPKAVENAQPNVATKMRVFFVSDTVDAEKLEYIKKACNLAFTADNQEDVILKQAKYSVMPAAYELENVKADKFISDTFYMMDYVKVRPMHPDWEAYYHSYVRTAIEAVLVDGLTAEQAVEQVKNDLDFNLDGVVIK